MSPQQLVGIQVISTTRPWSVNYDTYRTMEATRSRHGWVHMFITHCLTVTFQLHNFDLFRTCRTSSFCTVVWQLARFQLTRRIGRSLGGSWASCYIYYYWLSWYWTSVLVTELPIRANFENVNRIARNSADFPLQQGARKIPTDSCEQHVVQKQSDKDNEESKLSRLVPRLEVFHQLWRQPRRIADHHCRRPFSGFCAICGNYYIVQCVSNTATKTIDGLLISPGRGCCWRWMAWRLTEWASEPTLRVYGADHPTDRCAPCTRQSSREWKHLYR